MHVADRSLKPSVQEQEAMTLVHESCLCVFWDYSPGRLFAELSNRANGCGVPVFFTSLLSTSYWTEKTVAHLQNHPL